MMEIILVKTKEEVVKLGKIDLKDIKELGQMVIDLKALGYRILIQDNTLYILK